MAKCSLCILKIFHRCWIFYNNYKYELIVWLLWQTPDNDGCRPRREQWHSHRSCWCGPYTSLIKQWHDIPHLPRDYDIPISRAHPILQCVRCCVQDYWGQRLGPRLHVGLPDHPQHFDARCIHFVHNKSIQRWWWPNSIKSLGSKCYGLTDCRLALL